MSNSSQPFTQAVIAALRAAGWEEYDYPPDPDDGWLPPEPYWWIPAEHKNYWRDGKTGAESDNYRSLKDAISWQLHTDTTFLEELDVS